MISDSFQIKTTKLPKNTSDRLKYLYRLQEKLRLFHNKKGEQCRNGDMSMKEFRIFQNMWFEPRNILICTLINECKKILANDDTVICNISDIEEK